MLIGTIYAALFKSYDILKSMEISMIFFIKKLYDILLRSDEMIIIF